jgi:hypothetical protein
MDGITFRMDGPLNAAEVAVVSEALARHRRVQGAPAPEDREFHATEVDGATAESSERIFRGLCLAPLGPPYRRIFEEWLKTPESEVVGLEELAARTGASIEEVRARTSKLSGRMRKIATPEEIATLRTPFLLLADLTYDEKNYARYALTRAGRQAVRRFLGR